MSPHHVAAAAASAAGELLAMDGSKPLCRPPSVARPLDGVGVSLKGVVGELADVHVGMLAPLGPGEAVGLSAEAALAGLVALGQLSGILTTTCGSGGA